MGGNLFAIAFGRNLDAHSAPGTDITPSRVLDFAPKLLPPNALLPSESQCLDGRNCYLASLYMSTLACCLALALGIWAGWRERQKHLMIARALSMPAVEDGEI